MKINEEQKRELENLYQWFLHNDKMQNMREIPMHRGQNCFVHSFRVAKLAIKRALRHKEANLKVILLGSLLHDYYLYDWRKNKELRKHHGSRHPYIAAKKAAEDFDIDDDVQAAIVTHMWPINFSKFPRTKEARIISLADKTIAFTEFLTSKRYKSREMNRYINHISRLFDVEG